MNISSVSSGLLAEDALRILAEPPELHTCAHVGC